MREGRGTRFVVVSGNSKTRATRPPKPAPTDGAARVRAKITGMIRKHPPALTEAYNHALQKEADKHAIKRPPQKETRTVETEKKAHNLNQGNVACDFHHHFRTVPGME
jgi:hypothetical protein